MEFEVLRDGKRPPRTPSSPRRGVFNEPVHLTTLQVNGEPGKNYLTLIAADTKEDELVFERLALTLQRLGVAHQSFRRSEKNGGRVDMISIPCLKERRRFSRR